MSMQIHQDPACGLPIDANFIRDDFDGLPITRDRRQH
jgi:hypothetical protein